MQSMFLKLKPAVHVIARMNKSKGNINEKTQKLAFGTACTSYSSNYFFVFI